MIPRYTRPALAELWSEENKYSIWFDVELAAVEGWAAEGVVPPEAAEYIRDNAVLDVARAKEIEQVTRHDIAAFVQSLEEQVGEEYGRWIHFGLTSSDILDTTFAVQLGQAADLLLEDIDALMEVIDRRAHEHKHTPKIGRSHGIHAEPTTFGHTLAIWYDEMRRQRARLEQARETISYGKVSGSVGTFQNVPPTVEAYVCDKLDLKAAPASSQIVQRDRHAQFMATLGLIASSLEKFAVEIRHMQRTELREAEEKFKSGQKGSSSMPHKRNPVLTENVTGLARTIRGYITPALENVALWHERDISHSSVERMIGPDSTGLLDFALVRMTKVLDELVVYEENMRKNLEQTRGLPFSQRVLLALIRKGLSRNEAYARVQSVAMVAWQEERDFEALVRADEAIAEHLNDEELDVCFDLESALAHIDTIFERVFEPRATATR
jgi:adenylosuccinate lyase